MVVFFVAGAEATTYTKYGYFGIVSCFQVTEITSIGF
jgi:hypothetical protein